MDRNNSIPGDNSEYPLRKYLWLNLESFISSYFPRNYSIEKIYYFTAPVRDNPISLERQRTYWKALESIVNLEIQLGKHIPIRDYYSEKQSDVKMALQMYSDAIFHNVDCIVMVSADSDQIPTIERIIHLDKDIEIHAIFPPCRKSDEIKKILTVNNCYRTRYKRLAQFQFPDVVTATDFSVIRPKEWS
jgi:uncharacterized LabA/DUF88 family protein